MSSTFENYLQLTAVGLVVHLALFAAGCSAAEPPVTATEGGSSAAVVESEPAAEPPGASGATAAAPAPPATIAAPKEVSEELRRAWIEWAERGVASAPADESEWKVDERGRRYFTDTVPRMPGSHVLIDEGRRVILPTGLTLDLESYDEENLYVKIYGVPEGAVVARRDRERNEAERREQLAAGYVVDATTGDSFVFEPFDRGLPKSGQWRNGFALVDLDGDGELDIVHGPARKGGTRPVVFRGDGAGGWSPWREAGFPPDLGLDYGDVAVADFDRDGRLDVAFSAHLRGLAVVVAEEDGGFRRWSEGIELVRPGGGETEPPFSSRQIEAVDWNRDGWPDLVALGEGPRLAIGAGSGNFRRGSTGVAVFLNGGDGTWTRLDAGDEESRIFGDAMAIDDLDGDGLADLVIGPSTRGRKDLLYRGRPDGDWLPEEIPEVRDDAVVRAVEIADFDGDGRPDLALGWVSYWLEEWRTGVDVLLARDDGWQRRALGVEPGQAGIWALAAGDLDADGARDLVASTGAGDLWVFRGDGGGGFERQEAAGVEGPGHRCTGYAVALADVDGVPGDEVVAAFAGESGSEVLLQQYLAQGEAYCPSGGGIAAWRTTAAGAVGEGS